LTQPIAEKGGCVAWLWQERASVCVCCTLETLLEHIVRAAVDMACAEDGASAGRGPRCVPVPTPVLCAILGFKCARTFHSGSVVQAASPRNVPLHLRLPRVLSAASKRDVLGAKFLHVAIHTVSGLVCVTAVALLPLPLWGFASVLPW
jgi:hypothetical protein